MSMPYRQVAILIFIGLLAVSPAVFGQVEISKSTVSNTYEDSDTTIGPHGGKVFRRDQLVLEALIDPDGVLVYVCDTIGRPVNPQGGQGRCIFPKDSGGFTRIQFEVKKDSGKRIPYYRSKPVEKRPCLYAPYDFSLSPDQTMRMRIEFSNLPGQSSSTLGFSVPIVLARVRGWACRGHEDRIMLKQKNTPLCDKRYLVEVPILFQCPQHPNSRSDHESKCPLCSFTRVPTRQPVINLPQPRQIIIPGQK